MHNPLRYRGYVYDRETGLYYLESRYYNPEIGRFINADRYVSTGTGLLGFNMFAYCDNNPVNCVDPSGCFLECFLDDCDITDDFDNGMCGGMGAGTYHYGVDLSVAARSSSFGNGLLSCGYSSYGYTTPAYGTGGQSKNLVKVGRWMSTAEYKKMVETNTVQMSPNGNTAYVASPADKNAYGKQASPGSCYVEFSVPKECLYPAGNFGWAQIPGPGSLYDRLERSRGGAGIKAMPIAYDIQIRGEK